MLDKRHAARVTRRSLGVQPRKSGIPLSKARSGASVDALPVLLFGSCMSSDPRDDQVWYRLGYALERVRQATEPRGGSVHKAAPVIPSTPASQRGSLNPFLELGAGWLERQVAVRVQGWVGRRARTPWLGAAVGAALELAGAAALGMVRAEQRVRAEPRSDSTVEDAPSDDGERVLPPPPAALIPDPLGVAARGAAHGLIYGGLVAPLPAPGWAKGLGYGVARYLASAGGGLAHVLGPVSPHRAVPLLHTMVADEEQEDALVLHLSAGIALALIYGSSPSSSPASSGTTPGSDEDDD